MLVPLSLPPGLNGDDTTYSVEGQWADGNNVRFRGGKPEPIEGWSAGVETVAGTTYDLFLSVRAAGNRVFYGADTGLYIAVNLSDPTLNLNATAASGWAFAPWGEDVLCCVRGGKLYYQTGSSAAAEVTNAPDKITDMLVTPERQVLALGTNEESSGTFNALCIRGSDLEDCTDWTTSATNNAFEHILDGGEAIITARSIGPYVAVWTRTALFLGQFIGDPSQTYRFDKVADVPGPFNARSVVVVNGVAYWWGIDHRHYQWTPGAPPAQMQCPLASDFEFESETALAFAWHNQRYNEVWFHYSHAADENFSHSTRYVAYAVGESVAAQRPVWFKGAMVRSTMWQYPDGNFMVGMFGGPNASMFHHGDTENTNRHWHIQSADQYIDNSQRRTMVRGCIPDLESQSGDVSLTLFVRDRPQSSATTKGPFTLGPSTTKKDFRATGKLFAVKFSGAAGTFARLGKPLFDVVPLGER